MYQLHYIKDSSTNQIGNLSLLHEPSRVRGQIINVVRKIQRFDAEFDVDKNLVLYHCAIANYLSVDLVRF